MADMIKLRAEPRTVQGKAVRHLRRDGLTPIVVYGPKSDPVSLQTNSRELIKVLAAAGGTQLVAIDVEGETAPRLVLAKAVQRHVTRREPLHADFLQVVMTDPITKRVPVQMVGEAPAARHHIGILTLVMDQLHVRALPADLPQSIEIDVSGMAHVGDSITLATMSPPPNVEWAEEADTVVVRIEAARLSTADEAADELADAETLAEPELVPRGGGDSED
jgi:large subunit ribosomal protein L25